jgi:hypothetical protein
MNAGARTLSWAEAANEINHFRTGGHPIAPTTIRGLESKAVAEGDGVLQMLLWLGRTPESFVSGIENADAAPYGLKHPGPGRLLRWDARALYAALNSQRQSEKFLLMDIPPTRALSMSGSSLTEMP